VSAEATNRLKVLKARTGLTPNVLCRLALTLSLNEPGLPNSSTYDEQGQEFNRYTLTGEWDQLFIALLKERLVQDELSIVLDLLPQFKAHINRGVGLLYGRIKSLIDLRGLLPSEGHQPTIRHSQDT
jgi:DNA sulfur modification protein DndE